MRLAGQGASRGYAMAALLVGMSVMAVIMGALLPGWTHMMIREKEEELVFRGNQYVRAIGLFQRKFANTNPPTVDLLVEQRFLRKKYKDPITNDEFQPIFASQAAQGVSAPTGARRPGEQATASLGTPAQQSQPQSGFGSQGASAAGGIIGVTSKSKEASLRVYNGRTRYNEWAFIYVQTTQRPGGPGGVPGQPPGQRGQPFGMPAGSFGSPGQRPGTPGGQGSSPFGPGASQPSRPPVGGPGSFSTPGGSTLTPSAPGQQRPPRPPGL